MDDWKVDLTDIRDLRCDVCGGVAQFARASAPDCDVWGLVGVNGAKSDAYGIYCHEHNGRDYLAEIEWARMEG